MCGEGDSLLNCSPSCPCFLPESFQRVAHTSNCLNAILTVVLIFSCHPCDRRCNRSCSPCHHHHAHHHPTLPQEVRSIVVVFHGQGQYQSINGSASHSQVNIPCEWSRTGGDPRAGEGWIPCEWSRTGGDPRGRRGLDSL